MKKVNPLNRIFDGQHLLLIKKSIIKTDELAPDLWLSILQIGNEKVVLLSGYDLNENAYYSFLSESTFNKLKKTDLKRRT